MIQAINGGAAIRVVESHDVDVAIISHRMQPNDGFEVAKHVLVKGYDTGMVLISDDPTTDLLIQAGHHNIAQVMTKPIEPDRLIQTVRRLLRKRGKNPDAFTSGDVRSYTPQELMHRAVVLAEQNVKSGMGGPFGAVVADAEGHLLGEGVNGVHLRCDPTAHAEVIAIRRATDKRGSTRLEGCVVYSSSEPTMLGQALIISTGIEKVYYGASHVEAGTPRVEEKGIIGEIEKPISQRSVPYEQMMRDEALALVKAWQSEKKQG